MWVRQVWSHTLFPWDSLSRENIVWNPRAKGSSSCLFDLDLCSRLPSLQIRPPFLSSVAAADRSVTSVYKYRANDEPQKSHLADNCFPYTCLALFGARDKRNQICFSNWADIVNGWLELFSMCRAMDRLNTFDSSCRSEVTESSKSVIIRWCQKEAPLLAPAYIRISVTACCLRDNVVDVGGTEHLLRSLAARLELKISWTYSARRFHLSNGLSEPERTAISVRNERSKSLT